MENEKLFQLMEKMYVEMQQGFKKVDRLESEVSEIKKTIVKIEDEHGKKLEALLDGYKQNSEQLNRIEAEVSRHEEVIIRRIK